MNRLALPRTAAALALLACALPLAVSAQGAIDPGPAPAPVYAVHTVAAGDLVRVTYAGETLRGRVVRSSADSLVVTHGGRRVTRAWSDLSAAQRMTGGTSRGRSIVRGGLVGMLVGGASGYLLAGSGTTLCEDGQVDCVPGKDDTLRAVLGAEGVLLGALVGGMLGPTFRGTHWQDLAVSPGEAPAVSVTARARPQRAGGGWALGVNLRR